jgi:hypothetical protein
MNEMRNEPEFNLSSKDGWIKRNERDKEMDDFFSFPHERP